MAPSLRVEARVREGRIKVRGRRLLVSGPRQVRGRREGKAPSLKVEAHLRDGRGYNPMREGAGSCQVKRQDLV